MKKLINKWLGVTELYENQTYLMQDYAIIQETLSNCLDVLANLNYNLDKPKKSVSKKVNKVVKKKPVKKVAKK
jgi:hypothetical protein